MADASTRGWLVSWWCRRLRAGASQSLRAWRGSPEWPLLAVAEALVCSFVLHLGGFALARAGAPGFGEANWEGRTGWRKPIVFGISNALVFVSLAQALAAQELAPRRATAHCAAWATALEVGIVTLQAWRGVPSHFNTATPLDAWLYATKLCAVAILGGTCLLVLVGQQVRPSPRVRPALSAALRHGLRLLAVAVLCAVAMVAFGHTPRAPRAEEDALCLKVSGGASASPCYEMHGETELKILHFLPLHGTEALLLLAWAAAQPTKPPFPESEALLLVQVAAAGIYSIVAAALWQTLSGARVNLNAMMRLDLPWPVAGLVFVGTLMIAGPFVAVALAPLRGASSESVLGSRPTDLKTGGRCRRIPHRSLVHAT